MADIEKKLKQHREAVKRYSAKVDRINCLLPLGTKERIEKITGQSCNSFIRETVLKELDKIESSKDDTAIFL